MATLLVTAAGVGSAIAVLADVSGIPSDARDSLFASLCYLICYGVAGAFLISRRPELPFGWLLSGAAAALTLSLVTIAPAYVAIRNGNTSPLVVLALGLGSLSFVQIAVQGFINVRFPSGRITSRQGRVLNRLMIVGLVMVTVGGFLGDSMAHEVGSATGRAGLHNPLTGGTWVAAAADGLEVGAPLLVLLGLIAGLHIVARAFRATGLEREQLRWRAGGVILSLALFPLAITESLPSVVDSLDGVFFVLTLAIPVVRYHLWDIDAVIRRSAACALVSIVLVSSYLGIASVAAAFASERIGVLIAAVTVSFLFWPACNRGQRIVDHIFYGRRSDPYQALSDVSRRLEAAAEPGSVLMSVVSAVAQSLRLPFVAIEGPSDGLVLAVHGDPRVDGVERWPLTYRGVVVGALVASPRRGELAFDDRDRAVLADLARQCGAAVQAEALTADLVDSRQRLVNAREEERRRLRRDLHDGLGPMLTGLGLNLDAARTRLAAAAADPAATGAAVNDADTFLARAKDASSQAIADLRSIVYGLRPPALDDLGLVGAVRMHVERLVEGSPVAVTVDANDLPALPAAVEVAAFRTAVEAVNNTIRHAGAHTCAVQFCVDGDRVLVVEIVDDGARRTRWAAGVGLLAMRERTAELGGVLTAGPATAGGRVRACFPLLTGVLAAASGSNR